MLGVTGARDLGGECINSIILYPYKDNNYEDFFMTVWLKKKWLKSLLLVGACATLSTILFKFNVSPQTSQLQQLDLVSQSKSVTKLVSTTLSKSEEDLFSSSNELLIFLVTPEEIKLREQQLELTEEWVRFMRTRFQSGTGTMEELSEVVYFHSQKKIELLQSKNLLQLKEEENTLSPQPSRLEEAKLANSNAVFSEVLQLKPTRENLSVENVSVQLVSATLSELDEPQKDSFLLATSPRLIPLVISPEEIQLREQQLQAVKQIEKDAELLESAGLVRRSDVMRANILRLESEIELLQAKQLLKLKQEQ
jgi:hypothetical protein